MSASTVSFHVTPAAGGHRFIIQQTAPVTPATEIVFYLPIWIPGSYTRRDFARFLSRLTVSSRDGTPIPFVFDNPSRWRLHVPGNCDTLHFSYEIYARDISVRGCYLDHERGFFNPCCACLAIEGLEHLPQRLTLALEGHRAGWQVAGAQTATDGAFWFNDYAHMIDTPLMFAHELTIMPFTAGGVPHDIVVSGQTWDYDHERLRRDVQTVCREAVMLFGGLPPMPRYTFLLHLGGNIYGGLEHCQSTLLMASRDCLPEPDNRVSQRYIQLLGLFSHEYFHTWNVKALKPADYQTHYDLQREQPTEMLWLFEGFTAFFDNWLLVRSGVISIRAYLELLAQDIARYRQRPGRKIQTLADSSYEAWTKLYNGGEDAINTSTTYYIQGALAAFCLDIFLRQHSKDGVNLPMIMHRLWHDYRQHGLGLDESRFIRIASELLPEEAKKPLRNFIRQTIHSTEELPLEEAAAYIGLQIHMLAAATPGDLGSDVPAAQRYQSDPGFRWQKQNGHYNVHYLDEHSPAAFAGVAIGDQLIAVNGFRVDDSQLARHLNQAAPNSITTLHYFRDDIMHTSTFTLNPAAKDTCLVQRVEHPDEKTLIRQRHWFNRSVQDHHA
ncbi:MAG: M61 family peptidase [Cardiobacteriaceae bacterium]|nr:M61 family peptidase [Cardiobacteriaceae bacterium]